MQKKIKEDEDKEVSEHLELGVWGKKVKIVQRSGKNLLYLKT